MPRLESTRRWAYGRFLGAAEALGYDSPRRIAGAVTSAVVRTVPSALMAQLAAIGLLEDVVQQVILAMAEHAAQGNDSDVALMRAVQRAAYAALTKAGWRRLSRRRDRAMRWREREIPAGDGETAYELLARAVATGRGPAFRAMVQKFYGLPPMDDRDLRPWEYSEPKIMQEEQYENCVV